MAILEKWTFESFLCR